MGFRIHRGIWQFKNASNQFVNKYKLDDTTGELMATDAEGNVTDAIGGGGGDSLSLTGGSVSGLTHFTSSESLRLKGIRGQFTNEYMHLYNKVGIGHPSGWGQGQGDTPTYGLSTYGGANIGYGNNGEATFHGEIQANNGIHLKGNWVRVDGSAGLYFQTYGGGWRMTGSSYVEMYGGKSLNMKNGNIDYVNQVHFQDNVRFYDAGNDSILNFKAGDTVTGEIRFHNGSSTRAGSVYFDSACANFGLLNKDGQWAFRSTATNSYMYYDGSNKLETLSGGVRIYGDLSVDRVVDRNDGSYYVDPAGTSRMNAIQPNKYNGLVDKAYKEITVGGDADTFYPVRINGSAGYGFQRYSVSRRYNWTAPSTWNTSSHKGGLTLTMEWSSDTAWGGNDKNIRVIQFSQQYSTVCGGITLPVTGGLIVWLRGGGAIYHVHAPNGASVSVVVELDGYTAGNGTVYSTRTISEAEGTGATEIYNRYPVRGDDQLYHENNKVATETWVTNTAKSADANKLDGYDWMQSGKSMRANEFYADNWFRNYNSNEGMYNQATGQHWYSDSGTAWNMRSSNTTARIRLRTNGSTLRGEIYADSGNNVGFLDAGGSWAIKHSNDNGTYFYTDGTTEEFKVGRDAVTGSYGTVQTSTTRSSWGGYSINGQYVFMSNHGDNVGIYNDIDSEWMVYAQRNGWVQLYHNGNSKLATSSTGVSVYGTVSTSSHGTSANWKSAYDWGNHASAGYMSPNGSYISNNYLRVGGNSGIDRTINTRIGQNGFVFISEQNVNPWYPLQIHSSAVEARGEGVAAVFDGQLVAEGAWFPSDQRLKTNIQAVDTAQSLARVNALQLKTFTKIKTNTEELGLVAQEADAVDTNYTSNYYDSTDDTRYMTVNYSRIYNDLIGAIQEQQTIINELTARIEQLESK